MDRSDKLKLCRSCRDNFYNQAGNSTDGECWMLKSAEPVQRTLVGIWQNPPYDWAPQTTLSCHHPEGSAWIKETDVRLRKPTQQTAQ